MSDTRKFNTMNYLVPASGTTSGAEVKGDFSATPTRVDFRIQELDGEPFVPSGVYMDNSQGTAPLVVTIVGTGYTFDCKPGLRRNVQYPAPLDQVVEITGEGFASLVFVNYPVLPTNDLPVDFSPLQTTLNAMLTELGEINTDTILTNVTLGNTADAPWDGVAANATVISLLKAIVLKP